MLPLSLLRTAQNHPMLVELKNGETYNGHLVSCDNWMNINLREVICTSRDGDRFWRMSECYVRGSTIKYLRIPDEVRSHIKVTTVLAHRPDLASFWNDNVSILLLSF